FWERRPLSTQLVTLITTLLALGLIMSGTVMVGLLQRHLVSQIDEQLRVTASSFIRGENTSIKDGTSGLPTLYYSHARSISGDDTTYYYPGTLETSGTPVIPDLLATAQISETSDEITNP
ncbi:two-component sensor histidine kinase, partial [Pauljensenia sp. UMB3104]|nr:two-component sensor histidine kinase [Pauljensenia sp. UMB3104]